MDHQWRLQAFSMLHLKTTMVLTHCRPERGEERVQIWTSNHEALTLHILHRNSSRAAGLSRDSNSDEARRGRMEHHAHWIEPSSQGQNHIASGQFLWGCRVLY